MENENFFLPCDRTKGWSLPTPLCLKQAVSVYALHCWPIKYSASWSYLVPTALKHSREIRHCCTHEWWSSRVLFMWSFDFFNSSFFYSLGVYRNVCNITTNSNISRSLWSICLNFECYICICTAVSDIKPWCMFWIPTNYAISFSFQLLLLSYYYYQQVSLLHTSSNTGFICKIEASYKLLHH